MSKRTVRLTESDLHNIIKESVKKVLKEEFDSSDWTTNEYGEPVPWQYGDYENSRRLNRYYLSQDILNGDYDDEILNDWEDWYEELDDDNGWDSTLKDAAKDRRCYLDKNYAMNHGYKRSDNFYDDTDRMSMKRKLELIPDKEIKYDKEIDKLHKGRDFLRKKYGGNIPKEEREKLYDVTYNKYYLNTKRNPDKEKLHTKDSANRELIAMDRKKKQK